MHCGKVVALFKRRFSTSVAALLPFGALLALAVPAPAAPLPAIDWTKNKQRPDVAPGEYFVTFHGGVTPGNVGAVRSIGALVRRKFPEVGTAAVRIRHIRQLVLLRRDPRVSGVEPVPMRYKQDLATQQLGPTRGNGLYGLLTTGAASAHGRGVSGAGVRVGVADTSIDYFHPDIAPNYRGGIDTVSDDNDPINDDGETHGTHVAGTILAAANGVGVYGVAYNAELYHARVLGRSGGTSTDIMDGVRWLVDVAGCRVINLSLGGRLRSRTEESFYKQMRSRGVLIVCAAGNDGTTSLSYPAAYPVNIAVGAVDRNNVRAGFSNTGRYLDVVAPGVDVLSSVPRGQGREATVTSGEDTYSGSGIEFAAATSGVTGPLMDCGLGRTGDFPGSINGRIAVIRRGTTTFAEKVTNAQNRGAAAVVIYNNEPGGFTGTLGTAGSWVPVLAVSDAAGAALRARAGQSATVVNQVSDWDHYDGTSMATPHVTGVIALIWSASGALSHTAVETHLLSTCADLGAAGYDTTYGRGLVNADAAVARAGR